MCDHLFKVHSIPITYVCFPWWPSIQMAHIRIILLTVSWHSCAFFMFSVCCSLPSRPIDVVSLLTLIVVCIARRRRLSVAVTNGTIGTLCLNKIIRTYFRNIVPHCPRDMPISWKEMCTGLRDYCQTVNKGVAKKWWTQFITTDRDEQKIAW